MLEEILAHLHNWFRGDWEEGQFTITDNRLGCSLPLLDGQKIEIDGSIFWDGVWTWRADGTLQDSDGCAITGRDETFSGRVIALEVPPALIRLSAEIKDWCDANSKALNSPLQSESFNGYSYTKGTPAATDGGVYGWKSHFAGRLDRWRKIG